MACATSLADMLLCNGFGIWHLSSLRYASCQPALQQMQKHHPAKDQYSRLFTQARRKVI